MKPSSTDRARPLARTHAMKNRARPGSSANAQGRPATTHLRDDEDLKGIPVVVLTASTDDEDKAQTERLQVESYLTKPVDLDKFQALVTQLSRFWKADMVLPIQTAGANEAADRASNDGEKLRAEAGA